MFRTLTVSAMVAMVMTVMAINYQQIADRINRVSLSPVRSWATAATDLMEVQP